MAIDDSRGRTKHSLKLMGGGIGAIGIFWLLRWLAQRKDTRVPLKSLEPAIEISEVKEPHADLSRERKRDSYLANSVFLAECWLRLMQPSPSNDTPCRMRAIESEVGADPEWAFLVTGKRVGGMRLMTEIVPVQFAVQSVARVAFELTDFHRALKGLQRWGFPLHAVFHSHRFPGPVSPSAIDLDTQRRILEPIYPAIQAVFSEDGYIRFFSMNRSFNVVVFGKGIEHVGEDLYRLKEELRAATASGALWSPVVSNF